ncbi:MAG: hypothetical protein AB7W16_09160 [Candidatus Obscuribacterales bacterium]
MDNQLKSHPAHVVYRQALNWTEAKLQRHILARQANRHEQLGLLLALLSFRLPFYAKCTAALEDPLNIAGMILESLDNAGTDFDRAFAVGILSSIALEYMERDLDVESSRIQLLVRTAATLCSRFEERGLLLAAAIHELEAVLGRPLELEAICKMASKGVEERMHSDSGSEQDL